VDHALLGTDPAELAVVDQVAPCLAPVAADEAREGATSDAVGDVVDGGADDVVSAPDGEGLGGGGGVLSALV